LKNRFYITQVESRKSQVRKGIENEKYKFAQLEKTLMAERLLKSHSYLGYSQQNTRGWLKRVRISKGIDEGWKKHS
jgi:hypothetical protein